MEKEEFLWGPKSAVVECSEDGTLPVCVLQSQTAGLLEDPPPTLLSYDLSMCLPPGVLTKMGGLPQRDGALQCVLGCS